MNARLFRIVIAVCLALTFGSIVGSLAYNVYTHRNAVCVEDHRKSTDVGGIPATVTICDRWEPIK